MLNYFPNNCDWERQVLDGIMERETMHMIKTLLRYKYLKGDLYVHLPFTGAREMTVGPHSTNSYVWWYLK